MVSQTGLGEEEESVVMLSFLTWAARGTIAILQKGRKRGRSDLGENEWFFVGHVEVPVGN